MLISDKSGWIVGLLTPMVNVKRKWLYADAEFQYFGHLMQRANSLEKTLMLGKIEDKRRRGW